MNRKYLKYAFRITHIENIPHIIKYGITTYASPNNNPNYVSIGDAQIIDIRKDWTFKDIGIQECIPFYFGPRSPMLYVIQHGYNGVTRQNAEKIIYCVLRLDDIMESDLDCFFTNGHALSALTDFFGKDSLKDINKIIDYDDVYARYWNSDSDLDLKRRKEAELLVKTDIPAKYIRGYVVYNEKAKAILLKHGIAEKMIKVVPDYYF